MIEDNEIRWFAIGCVSSKKELKVRDDIRNYGLEAFVPLKYNIKTIRQQKHRALVPAIPGLMFAKGSLEQLKEYIEDHAHFPVYLRKSTFSNKEDYLTVRTKDMEEFIAVTEDHEAHITYFRPEEINLQAGDRIRVKGGIYDGKEGIVMRIKGKRNKHLVVQIPGMLVAAVEMKPELVEPRHDSEEPEKPSKDVEGDKKLLFEYAYRVLFEITGRYKEDTEYYLLMSEIKRAKARLSTIKGFTPATEAELALPMFMASVILEEDVEKSRERLEKAMDRLKESSNLKKKCLEIMRSLDCARDDREGGESRDDRER